MPDGLKRLDPQEVTPVLLTALQTGAVIGPADVGVLAVSGPGAVACVQGLLTNDIEKPGDDAFVYGALLTPKGMIVRSEEHTSELQSRLHLVCRLLLEKKKY